MIVVDASLAAKWFLPEDGRDAALRFLARYTDRLHGPDILLTEVSGAIIRRPNIDKPFRNESLALLAEWWLVWERMATYRATAESVEQASYLAPDLGHPLPDCLYLQLAIEHGCVLATCDEKFRVKALHRYDQVRLLHQVDD